MDRIIKGILAVWFSILGLALVLGVIALVWVPEADKALITKIISLNWTMVILLVASLLTMFIVHIITSD